jgi:hypothetical protein
MLSATEKLKHFLYSVNWDTRGRNLDVVRILKPLLQKNSKLLDAGCGEFGLASFLPSAQVTGVDIINSKLQSKNFSFLRGSIISLPFSEKSFSIAASVDVLEHLPPDIRHQAISELVRVARDAVIIAFPCGSQARQIDESFAARLNQSDKSQPKWLDEHLQHLYPRLDLILSAIETEALKHNKSVCIKTFYSERIQIARLIRWAASHSNLLFMAVNLLAGIIHPITLRTNKSNSYRVILLAKFS